MSLPVQVRPPFVGPPCLRTASRWPGPAGAPSPVPNVHQKVGMGRNDPAQMNEPPFAQVMLGGRSSGPSPGLNGGGSPTWGRCSTKRRRGQCHWPSRDAGRARSADASCLAEVLGMRFANTQVTTAAKVNNAMRWLATVTGCDRTLWYGVGRWARLWCGGPLAWFSMRVFSANPWLSWRIRRRLVGHRGVPCGRCTNIADIELKTAARAALVGMTVELLTVLSCWPNTAPPAHALADLRTRRARMARHAGWFYKLPRHVRWLLAGTDRVQSLLAFAVSSPIMGEQSGRAWRKAVVALNELAKSAQGAAPKPSPTHVEPEHTDLPGSSDLLRHRRATRCLRGTPETAPRESVTTATAARVLPRQTIFARLPHLISSWPKAFSMEATGRRFLEAAVCGSRRFRTMTSPRSPRPRTGKIATSAPYV